MASSEASSSSSLSPGCRKRFSSLLSVPTSKKPSVSKKTVHKWMRDNDKSLNTSTWLDFEMDGDRVSLLRCKICCKFKDRLESMRNFRLSYIEGSSNVKTSSFKEHADSEMHKRAMELQRKSQGTATINDAPIVQSLAGSTMDKVALERTKKKFDVAYFIAKEGLAFTKMKSLCELEERHGVDIGPAYRNDHACSNFIEYIALEEKDRLVQALSKSRFYSFQVDSSTDIANVEEELFLVIYLESSSSAVDSKVQVINKFFCVQQPARSTAEGLYNSFEGVTWVLKKVGR